MFLIIRFSKESGWNLILSISNIVMLQTTPYTHAHYIPYSVPVIGELSVKVWHYILYVFSLTVALAAAHMNLNHPMRSCTGMCDMICKE